MFIHSPRILFYLPTRSRLCLFPLPPTLPRSLLCHWFAGYYLPVFWTAAGRVAASSSSLRLVVKKTAKIRAFASTLQGPLFQLSDSERILHAEQFFYQPVFREPVRRWAELATLLVCWCVSVWGKGVSPAPVISCLCQMELKNNNGLLGAWAVTSRDTRPRSSHSRDISESETCFTQGLSRGQIYNQY